MTDNIYAKQVEENYGENKRSDSTVEGLRLVTYDFERGPKRQHEDLRAIDEITYFLFLARLAGFSHFAPPLVTPAPNPEFHTIRYFLEKTEDASRKI